MSVLAAVAGALALAAGCGGSSSGAGSSSAPRSAPPSVASATTAQFASVVAPYSSKLAADRRALTRCLSGFGSCLYQAASGGLDAATLLVDLRGASMARPGNKLFVGSVPPEIAVLTQQTIEAAARLKRQATHDQTRRGQAGTLYAIQALEAQLDGWKPYGG